MLMKTVLPLLLTCAVHTSAKVLRASTPLNPETEAALDKVANDVHKLKVPDKAPPPNQTSSPGQVSQCTFMAGHVSGELTQQCCGNIQVVMQRQLHHYHLASNCKPTWKCEADGVTPQKAFEAKALSGLCGEPGCLPGVVKALEGNSLTAHSAPEAGKICSRLAAIGGDNASPEQVSTILSASGSEAGESNGMKCGDDDKGEIFCEDGSGVFDRACDKGTKIKSGGKEMDECEICPKAGCKKDKGCRCDEGSCFPGEAVVDVEGAGKTLLRDVREGDRILVDQQGSLAYEPVLSFLHSLPAGQHRFKSIVHEGGALRASLNHIVIVATDSKGSSWKSKLVDDVQVGDYVFSSQNGTMVPSQVKALYYGNTRSGMFAPLTYSGTIVVDGVVASNYASRSSMQYLPHSLVHAFLLPVRLYHQLVLSFWPAQSSKRRAEVTSAELHPYLQIMQHLSVLVPSK